MIKEIKLIGVFVNDQQAALDFYTNTLGLEKVQDEPYSADARRITVSPPGAPYQIVLKKAERDYERAIIGRSDGGPVLSFSTDDVQADYDRLRQQGAHFLGEPTQYPWGLGA